MSSSSDNDSTHEFYVRDVNEMMESGKYCVVILNYKAPTVKGGNVMRVGWRLCPINKVDAIVPISKDPKREAPPLIYIKYLVHDPAYISYGPLSPEIRAKGDPKYKHADKTIFSFSLTRKEAPESIKYYELRDKLIAASLVKSGADLNWGMMYPNMTIISQPAVKNTPFGKLANKKTEEAREKWLQQRKEIHETKNERIDIKFTIYTETGVHIVKYYKYNYKGEEVPVEVTEENAHEVLQRGNMVTIVTNEGAIFMKEETNTVLAIPSRYLKQCAIKKVPMAGQQPIRLKKSIIAAMMEEPEESKEEEKNEASPEELAEAEAVALMEAGL